ncbi:putative arginyl-tRNA--protein transferase [Campylobacterota bacterium]|nr:putative arginyl-tRNA--protein transferase [Campylobacterota bacterium]
MQNTHYSTHSNCAYIEGNTATTMFRIDHISSSEYDLMLERGWRRFGKFFFFHNCPLCRECIHLRVDVRNFVWTRSFNRVIKKGEAITVSAGRAAFKREYMELFMRYHDERTRTRGWEQERGFDAGSYCHTFVDGANDYGFQFEYRLGGKLIGVALMDVLPRGVSAVYCYYDPRFSEYSIGTFSVLQQILLAQKLGKPYLYLGFLVKNNASLQYKMRYKPYETLNVLYDLDQHPIWNKGDY